jgi:cation diffusion facilitator family transporter
MIMQNTTPIEHDEHTHDSEHHHAHSHTVDLALYQSTAGLRVVKISTLGMFSVALIQIFIALYGGSAGLFADALHNFGDIFTTIALWYAFVIATRPPTRKYTFGYHRVEDIAGIFILLIIFLSAIGGATESISKLLSGSIPVNSPLGMIAALVGVVGNEVMAQYKIAMGKRIQSMPLIADGHHSRVDGLASLTAFIGLVFAHFGMPLADPVAGLVISCIILEVFYTLAKDIFRRILDATDPDIIDQIATVAESIEGIREVDRIRIRWVGHTLHIMLDMHVAPEMTIAQSDELAAQFRHVIMHSVENISEIFIYPIGCTKIRSINECE